MSTEKKSLSSVNDESELKFDYNYSAGRLSPSSWDDSNEELSDGDSCITVEIPTEDRRQSLARVKRRTRSISSPVFDTDNANDKDSSDEFVTYSAKPDSHEGMSSDLSPVHQSWNDWDSEEIILGIENYLNEKRLSLIRSKIAGNQSNINESVPVLNGKGTNQTEIFSSVDFRSNFNGKLSKIVEVEESKSIAGLRGSETPRSSVPLCSQTNNTIVGCTGEDISDLSYHDNLREGEIPRKESRNHRVASVTYSSGDKFLCLTDDNDSDDSVIWQRIRSEIKRKNSEYAMTYEDSEYVSSNLKFIFDEKVPQEPSRDEEIGIEFGDEKEQLDMKDVEFENEMYAGGGENRNGEKENESITVVADLPEKMVNNTSSKETVYFGLENLFHLGEEHCQAECCASGDDFTSAQDEVSMPCSGREAFLVRESSAAWNIPNTRPGSKRARSNHTISLAKSEKLTNYLKETDQIMYFKKDWERNQLPDNYVEREVSVGKEYISKHGGPRKKDDSYSNSNTERMSNNKTCIINANDEECNGRDSPHSSFGSFRSRMLLDLNLSDNEEKCSTIERMMFGDSLEHVNKCGTPGNPASLAWSTQNNMTVVKQNTTSTGKPGTRPTEEPCNENAHIRACDCHQFGIGGNKWNSDETIGRKMNYPKDRGDIMYERPDTNPGWSELILSLEGTYPNKQTKENVFWVDLSKNTPDYQLQDSTGSLDFQKKRDAKLKTSENEPGNTLNASHVYPYSQTRKTKCRRLKAKKRKREGVNIGGGRVFGDVEIGNQWGNRLFDRRGNWLVNTVTRREDVLTRSKRWFQTLTVTRKRGRRPGGHQRKWHSSTRKTRNSSKSTGCFCHLFTQIVNIFTVSRKFRKEN